MARSPTRRPPPAKKPPVSARKAADKPAPKAAQEGAKAPSPPVRPAPIKATVNVTSTPVEKKPAAQAATPAAATPEVKPTPAEKPAVKAQAPAAPAPPVVKAEPPAIPVAPPPPVATRAEPSAKAPTEKAVKAQQENAKQESVKMPETISGTAFMPNYPFTDVSEQAKSALEKGTKMIEEFNDFAKGNVEAVVAAGRAAAKGAETLGQNAAEYSRKSFEEATKAMKTLSGAKSPTEFFKLQNDFAKTQFDSLIAEASKMSETMVKIFGDVAEPISSRVAVAADKVKTTMK